MQRKPQPAQTEPDQPPSPLFVAAVSLFGYPGAGHFLVGRQRQGIAFGVLFTLATLGVVFELWTLIPELLKLLRQLVDMQEAITLPQMPNLPRIALWTGVSGAVWLASAVHSALLAKERQAAHRAQQGGTAEAPPALDPPVAE